MNDKNIDEIEVVEEAGDFQCGICGDQADESGLCHSCSIID